MFLNYHPDSARVDIFRNGKCVVSEPKANTPLVDDPEVRANAIAARSDDKSNLPYCFYGLSMVIVCLLNACFDRLGFCSLVVMLAGMAYYQWQYCDSIFTMMLCWLVTPIVVFLARNLGNKIRVVNAVRRSGGYLVSADIDVRVYDSIKPTKKDVKVKFFAPQGGIQNFKDPFMSVNISKSCKAILVHPLGNYCEFFVYVFDKAVTDDLYERFRKPVLIKFGFNVDSKDKFSFLESISDK